MKDIHFVYQNILSSTVYQSFPKWLPTYLTPSRNKLLWNLHACANRHLHENWAKNSFSQLGHESKIPESKKGWACVARQRLEKYPGWVIWAIVDLKTFKEVQAKSRHHHDFCCLNSTTFSYLSAIFASHVEGNRFSTCKIIWLTDVVDVFWDLSSCPNIC